MKQTFDAYRWVGQWFVSGWLEPEVFQIIKILDAVQREKNISGAVAEIGVHHGRFFIGLSLLQRPEEKSVAIDIFDDQDLNIDNSGKGNLAVFRKNLLRWSKAAMVVVHQGDSTALDAHYLLELAGGRIRFFSIDGGHTESIVLSDMKLMEETLGVGGVAVADDIFNEQWPGVSGGTFQYLDRGGNIVPFAIGFNKVFFAHSSFVELYQTALKSHFDTRMLLYARDSSFAGGEVVIIGRVARRPRDLLARSRFARNAYGIVRDRVQRVDK